ncbi:hypothetical protein [Novosphingobium sp. NDB2Meth1]|jgi:hypothetical protein|uniref:hypothetical protein n=1 Tax=Novosphingobium sp. NDB2Meth1 TaxID=1892847 RepID=UPI000B01149C|nr:hypothetical protein [Novosphingobium sp. NDB2Meth1]
MRYFSPSTRGFYTLDANAGFIPDDAVEIDDNAYEDLMAGQATGQQILAGKDGMPVLADPPLPSDAELITRCKETARSLLAATDYTQAADVAGALKNASAFTDYRAALRAIFRNPVKSPKWPETPQPDWG